MGCSLQADIIAFKRCKSRISFSITQKWFVIFL